jgi:outer membrane cobalamin receptor
MKTPKTMSMRSVRLLTFLLFLVVPLFGQSRRGELRLKVTDPSGLGVRSSVELISEASHFEERFSTDEAGVLVAKNLPFGLYRIQVQCEGFVQYTQLLEVRSAVPAELRVSLSVAAVSTAIVVSDNQTLVDPHRVGVVQQIGTDTLDHRSTTLPGRSVIEQVNSEPGWLLEANGVVHPRGSEYQTQYVVDGIPLTDNRSPAFAPEMGADDIESLTIFTSSFPAEYGRKLGGVVEIVTKQDSREGLHGEAMVSGGSFDTLNGYAALQYSWGKNTLGASAGGAATARYLDPPVLENFTNAGTTADFTARYSRELTERDRLSLFVRYGLARFGVPNELVQQAAGQIQNRNDFETAGMISYQHIFSTNVLADFRAMGRDLSAGLASNDLATPIIAGQNRGFREGYLKATLAVHHGHHEFKAGLEADFASLREEFNYIITDPSQFDPGTPSPFDFSGRAQDREQSVFVQDLIRLGRWTASAGLRWDHYHLLVEKNAVSPRLGVAWYWPRADMVFHASYDRVFQTPAFENLLLASSPSVVVLNPNVLHLPVPTSLGNYYEVGATKGFFGKFKLDASYFDRGFSNFADDDLLLDTGISFPISFRKGEIYGVEAKIEIPHWGPVSGFLSYSYIVGFGYTPITGGLFLGDEATTALLNTGRFPVSQDQRNTARARIHYQAASQIWLAFGGEYGSGLPMEFSGTPQDVIENYGPAILNRINLARGRVRPSLSLDASAGVDLWKKDARAVRFQADILNINNRINVINCAGLFSGTAVAPPRSYMLRLQTTF